jgi:transposase InsO family protein
MDQRVEMIGDWLSGSWSVAELSQVYGVSRKTIYKWIGRYEMMGPGGLEERSRAPGSRPNGIAVEVAEKIIAAKMCHQKWGPRKVIEWLKRREPGSRWPAVSTAAGILSREGLVRKRRKRRRTPPYRVSFTECEEPNQVWSADFKGHFATADGKVCYPLTISDNGSRYLLACRGLSRPTFEQSQPWFEWVFRNYGLPQAIRTDNGAPFASVSLGGLSRLSIWFIKLGIRPERIQQGHPEQNGRHERMHRSLKEATAQPPKSNPQMQQKAFDEFIQEYNYERPHEALGQETPASVYTPSPVPYPPRTPKVEYDDGVDVRQIRQSGEMKWKGRRIYVSQALAGEPVGLSQVDDRLWEVCFGFQPLGTLDGLVGKIVPWETPDSTVLPMSSV